jgi:hypothetical protein
MNFREIVRPSPVPSIFLDAVPDLPELLEYGLLIFGGDANPVSVIKILASPSVTSAGR